MILFSAHQTEFFNINNGQHRVLEDQPMFNSQNRNQIPGCFDIFDAAAIPMDLMACRDNVRGTNQIAYTCSDATLDDYCFNPFV